MPCASPYWQHFKWQRARSTSHTRQPWMKDFRKTPFTKKPNNFTDSICLSSNLHSGYSLVPRAASPSLPLPGWCRSGRTTAPPSSCPQPSCAQRRGGSERRGCSAPAVPACWRWFYPGRRGWVLSAHSSFPSVSCPASEPHALARCSHHCGPCPGCPWPPG